MNYIPLTDEETYVIFGGETIDNLDSLDATKQRIAIERLLTIATSHAPPDEFIYERIGNIDILRAGDSIRLYTKIVPRIPRDDPEYHLIYVLFIDSEHNYNKSDLGTFSPLARVTLDRATSLETITAVEGYLDSHDAFSPDDLRTLLSW